MLRLVLTAVIAGALLALAAACGSGGDSSSPTPTTVAPASPTNPSRSPVAGDKILDLAGKQPLSLILGADSGDYSNDLPALTMGDINGDGLKDLLIGARFGDGPANSRMDAGEAYIIFGKADLPANQDLAQGQADVTVYGAQGQGPISPQGDQLGFSGALGDVNADGLDDIVLGAPMAGRQDNRAMTGAVFVILGRKDMPRVIDLAQTPADLTLVGSAASSLFGDSVTAGDVNGDGSDDVIVGSVFEPRPRGSEREGQLAGAVFVFHGGAISGTRDTGRGEYDTVIYGAEEFQGGDETGDNVATGDLNHDGVGDIAITAEAADGPNNDRSVAAEVYVVYGSADLPRVVDIGAGEQDVIVYGADPNDTTGFNIGVGDVTGDGNDDLMVSLRGGDGPSNRVPEAGELHIFPGPSLPSVIDLAGYDGDRYIYGTDSADFLGNGLALADWDGDGEPDLAVGSPMADGPANDSVNARDTGEVYIIDARDIRGGVAAAAAPVRLLVYGAHAEDAFGQSIAAGDMNGDGRPELAVLAMRADRPDGSQADSGAIYIITP